MKKQFPLGTVLITEKAWNVFEANKANPIDLVGRHVSGDCSDMTEVDQEAKREAIKNGSRVFSSYKLAPDNTEIWILTASDNEETKTSVFLPEEF